MSRTLSEPLATNLRNGSAQITTLWQITKPDGTVERWTAHDSDLTVSGHTWTSSTAYTGSTTVSRNDVSVLNQEIRVGEQDGITAADVEAGSYDGAEVIIFIVDWTRPQDGADILDQGTIGNISVSDGQVTFEFRSRTQALQQPVGRTIGPTCDADFGDSRCKVDKALWTVTGTAAGGDQETLLDPVRTEADNWFAFGELTMTGGKNSGYSVQVASSTAGSVALNDPLPFPILAGDTYEIVAGCDKLNGTCFSKFSNRINFRGFPDVPGGDDAYKTTG